MPVYNSDIELYNAFHRGEETAIRHLYHLHFKPLCLFAYRFTGEIQDAEDLVTNSFIKLLGKREQFQNLSNIKYFLYLVTKNACLNHIEMEARHQASHKEIRFLSANNEIQHDKVQEELLESQVFMQIWAEVENLPDRCREIFKLLFIEGLSTDQAAQRLSISGQTVRNQKTKALQLIRTELLKKNLLPAILFLALIFPPERFSA